MADDEEREALFGTRGQRRADLAKLSASTGAGYLASRVRSLRDGDGAEARFHAATAEKMLELLGSMKGAAMKMGQIASFVDLDLPPEAQETYRQTLGQLRDAAPPIDPELVTEVISDEYGAPPEDVFAEWESHPIAAASIGQVHRARLEDGTRVAVKVQYPGVAEAIEADLANAESFMPLARLLSPNLAIKPLMAELRDRLLDELDYQREAEYQEAFAVRYDGHPFIRVPRVHAEYCRPRIIVTDFADGVGFDAMLESSDAATRRRYGEIIYRFVFGSLHRFRLFNADPHPGNYLFPGDGTVVFVDFGSVKLFSSRTRDQMQRQLRATWEDDTDALVDALDEAGFIPRSHRTDTERLLEWFKTFNRPILEDAEWEYTPEFAREVIRTTTDPRAGYVDLLRKLNLPADYLLLNRIQWGVNSILGRLSARANWHAITREMFRELPSATELGNEEAEFLDQSAYLV